MPPRTRPAITNGSTAVPPWVSRFRTVYRNGRGGIPVPTASTFFVFDQIPRERLARRLPGRTTMDVAPRLRPAGRARRRFAEDDRPSVARSPDRGDVAPSRAGIA